MVKCILASYSIVLPHLVRENDRETLKKVLGTSIGGHWANSIMPTVFTYQAEHRNEAQKTDEKGLKPVARGKTGALNIKKKLDSVIHITMNSSVLAFNQETRTSLPKVEEVENALNAYREAQVGNTMQYPKNIGIIQASRVDRIGNYVCYLQLGGNTMDVMDQGDDAVILHCQELNESVLEIIKQNVQSD